MSVPATTPQQTPSPATGVPPPFASASLYVGDLPSDVAESQLFEIFNSVGPVASIRVCRDVATRRSLGYGYVNFHSVNDADRALDIMNNTLIKGKPCRIMWSQRDPSVRKSGVGNIFIKNLAKSIDHKQLHDTFSEFGNILSCKVALDDQGRSRGYGFVHFETDEMAAKAVARVNGKLLAGEKVFVGPFVPRKERLSSSPAAKFTNIYVKNVDESVTTDQLKDIFGRYGPIGSAVIMTDKAGKSRGFGFINFEKHEDAAKAVEDKNGKTLIDGGKVLYCGRAQKKSERESDLKQKFEALKLERAAKYQGVNLYIKNLDDEVSDDKLREVFSAYGVITSCKIMRDEKGNSKGFGFVCYEAPEETTKAANEVNGKIIFQKPLYVALAQRKEIRRAQLEAQHAARAKGRLPGAMVPQQMYGAPPVFYGPTPVQGFYGQAIQPRNRGYYNPQIGAAGYNIPHAPPLRQQQGAQRKASPSANQHNRNPRGPYPNARRANEGGGEPEAPLSRRLATIPASDHLNLVGEALFPLVEKRHPEEAGKITGMLLDRYSSNFTELALIMENEDSLVSKISEANEVLLEHNRTADK